MGHIDVPLSHGLSWEPEGLKIPFLPGVEGWTCAGCHVDKSLRFSRAATEPDVLPLLQSGYLF